MISGILGFRLPLVQKVKAPQGTTLAVASEEGRRWIGIDNSREAIETMVKRFENGLERMGDFVSERNGKHQQKEVQTALPFEEKLNGNGLHSVITDYQLLATAEFYPEAFSVLESLNRKRRTVV